MQVTIDVPDSLPAEFLKLRIQEIEQNLKNEAKYFSMYSIVNQETLLAIEAVEWGEVELTSLDELRKLAQG
ncbi:MAG: hypothetical protein WCK96_18065 [Methylococcales bacterium]